MCSANGREGIINESLYFLRLGSMQQQTLKDSAEILRHLGQRGAHRGREALTVYLFSLRFYSLII